VCNKGTLALVSKSLVFAETVESRLAHGMEEWGPELIEYVFTAWAECRHPSCKQRFAISGIGGLDQQYVYDGEDGGFDWQEYFVPKMCNPMPRIIEIPTKCPKDVRKEIEESFSLFWPNRSACAGRMRVALEHLMNHLGVPKRRKSKNGNFSDLTLHARIDFFAQKDSAAGAQLMALKSLGNTGSHDSGISRKDLLDAFEILEHALEEVINQRSAKVAALAKKLTKKHRGKR
jgi:hypothetical protein